MSLRFYLFLLLGPALGYGQSYISYFTGNQEDFLTQPDGGICMMGGSSESDEAMRWFLRRAKGGDILVLRASGSDGYNDYLFRELGVTVNSVETIVFRDSSASADPDIHRKIRQAEAIWFAGGDQWNYVSFWRGTMIDSLINEGIRERQLVIGGTSAGMAILGGYYFSARNNTVTSAAALQNPYDERVTVDSAAFLSIAYLSDVVTDTHYDQRDRRGRQVVFLARILADYGLPGKGIACNERTAVCIDTDGTAYVYGGDPQRVTHAYFIQTNCELEAVAPEQCRPGLPLVWDREGAALKVYVTPGNPEGGTTFSLKDWKTGDGGTWEHWYVRQGEVQTAAGSPPDCRAGVKQ